MSSSLLSEEKLPRRFGEFILFDKIGQGGMAEIFLAKALGTLGQQRLTVIKRVLPMLSADPQFSEMLVDEAKLCARLNHKNVVQVTDLGRIDERLYIAMEYVEGFDLNDLLSRCSRGKVPLPPEFVFFILEETMHALDYAHRAIDGDGKKLSIIHRDVSPTNVLISVEGEVKLCDFGIARAAVRDGALPDEALKGKFAYMSPEHARGEAIDQRTDLFAAGILLWELIAGHRLYRGSAEKVIEMARAGDIPPLPERGLPKSQLLTEIVGRALAKTPEKRFQTAQEMLGALGSYVQDTGMFASQLKFAGFISDNFGVELQKQRRGRERASMAISASPGGSSSLLGPSSSVPLNVLRSPQSSGIASSPPRSSSSPQVSMSPVAVSSGPSLSASTSAPPVSPQHSAPPVTSPQPSPAELTSTSPKPAREESKEDEPISLSVWLAVVAILLFGFGTALYILLR